MARIVFTPALRRFLKAPQAEVGGATVGAALAMVFAGQPALRGYLLDDQGAVRPHVNIFVNGDLLRDRIRLSDAVGPDDEIYVFQALTGG